MFPHLVRLLVAYFQFLAYSSFACGVLLYEETKTNYCPYANKTEDLINERKIDIALVSKHNAHHAGNYYITAPNVTVFLWRD